MGGVNGMKKVLCNWLLLAVAMTLGCQRPSQDWNGEWKVNPSKGNFYGPIFSISISADQEFRYDDGRSSFTFRCDGKDRPAGENRTRACAKSSSSTLDLTQKAAGVKTSVSHWELSNGGTVLTLTSKSFRPSSNVITAQVVASRMSGSNDFSGQWQDMTYLHQHADMTLKLENQTLHISYTNAGQFVDAPLNGADAPVQGPNAPKGTTYALRLSGQREFLSLTKQNGIALTQGSLQLDASGRTITESWWSPGKPRGVGTLIYERK